MLHPYCSRTMADYKVDRKAFVEEQIGSSSDIPLRVLKFRTEN